MNFTARRFSLARLSKILGSHQALIACLLFLLTGCVVTPTDFCPRLEDGQVTFREVSEVLNVPEEDVLFVHTGFFDRDYEVSVGLKHGYPSSLAISTDRVSVISWDPGESEYRISWSRKLNDISKVYYTCDKACGVVFESMPDENGVQEIRGFAVAHWTGVYRKAAAEEAVRIFMKARDDLS